MAYATETSWPLIALRPTVKVASTVPALPSATVTSPTDSVGVASSSVIVPMPSASPRVAFVGALSVKSKVSFASSSTSPFTCTVTVCEVSPAAKSRMAACDTKSASARAVLEGLVDGADGSARRRGERDVEGRADAAAVALGDRHVVDRDRRLCVVVGDRAQPEVVAERRVGRARERDRVVLVVGLVEHVARDRHGDGLRRVARREAELAAHGAEVLRVRSRFPRRSRSPP